MARKKLPPMMSSKAVDKWLRHGLKGKHLDGRSRDSVRGLILAVYGPRSASWVLRYQLNGKIRHLGLGSAYTFSLAEARDRARAARQKLADGIDPLEVKRSERAAAQAAADRRMTFSTAADRWFKTMEPKWSSKKHASNVWRALENWALPILGKRDVSEIDKRDMLRVLQQPLNGRDLWLEHTETASRLRANLEAILTFATASEARSGDNPARWSDLKPLLPDPSKIKPVERMAALPYRDVPALVTRLSSRESISARH